MGLFDDAKNEINEQTIIERIEELGISAENLSVTIEDGITYISGTVESDDDLAKIEEEFASGLFGSVKTQLDIDVVSYYTIEDGDSPWAVAEKFYGDGNKYPILV
jgi:nucleoid-associated protein YgaU